MLSNKKSFIAALTATFLLAACGTTPPTRFYTLAGPTPAVSTASTAGKTGQTFIEVMPVAVPERLARPQLVLRTDPARVDVLETERWSSPLNSELRDALSTALSTRLGAVDIARGSRPADQVSYRIAVDVRDLDAVRNGQVRADVGWTVTRSDDRKAAVCRRTVIKPVNGSAISDVVLAMQQMVADVADAVAADVRGLQAGQAAACRR